MKRSITIVVFMLLILTMPVFATQHDNEQQAKEENTSSQDSKSTAKVSRREKIIEVKLRIMVGASFFSRFRLAEDNCFYSGLPWEEYNSSERINQVVELFFETAYFYDIRDHKMARVLEELIEDLRQYYMSKSEWERVKEKYNEW